MYYSPHCQYFYIGVFFACLLLIIITIVDGFKIAQSTTFICMELLINIVVTTDFSFRVRMFGFFKFLNQNIIWNKLDMFIVTVCNFLFIISIMSNVNVVGEISDEFLLISWSIA